MGGDLFRAPAARFCLGDQFAKRLIAGRAVAQPFDLIPALIEFRPVHSSNFSCDIHGN